MFTICRIYAFIKYWLYLEKHGVWRSDYFAICYYAKFNRKKAIILMNKFYPEFCQSKRLSDNIK